MQAYSFRKLEVHECAIIKEIDASQYIGKAWRPVNGERVLVDIDYHDPDWPNGYETHLGNLKQTITGGGCAIGAFDPSDRCIGMVAVNRPFFGHQFHYVLLDQLFISREKRGFGIGKALLLEAAKASKSWGADKLYICAGSAEETIAFYKAIGCIEALEPQRELAESDPRDMQLEYDLGN